MAYAFIRQRFTIMAREGNLGLGVIVGFAVILVLGWIPFIRPFIAGLVAGALARGPIRSGVW